MTSKVRFAGRYGVMVFIVLIVVGLLCFSYSSSKRTAEKLVGPSLQYFALTKARIELGPFQKNNIVWFFQFSHPSIMDAEFEIYTSLFGDLVLTNPKDLKNRLTANEKLEVNPYSVK